MLSKTKLAMFDIDGTLFDHDTKQISNRTIDSLRQLKDKDIRIGICTSRCYEELNNVSDDVLNLMDVVVTSAGARVTVNQDHQNIITLKQDDVDKIIDFCDTNDMLCRYSTAEAISYINSGYNESSQNFFYSYYGITPELKKYHGEKVVNFLVYDEDPAKIAEFLALDFDCDYTMFTDTILEVRPKGIDKAAALDFLADYYQISLQDIIAFGDDKNDITMMKKAGFGVAMGNGVDATKEAADFVTKTVAEDGITHALQKYNLVD